MHGDGPAVADAVAAVHGDAASPERHLVEEEGFRERKEDHGCGGGRWWSFVAVRCDARLRQGHGGGGGEKEVRMMERMKGRLVGGEMETVIASLQSLA